MWPPIETSDAIPPGTIYFIPPDVMKAMRDAEEVTMKALTAMIDCWLITVLFDDVAVWLLLLPNAIEKASRTAKAATYAIAGAELLIRASGKRIGVITNIGEI